jgi:hypothetical protein
MTIKFRLRQNRPFRAARTEILFPGTESKVLMGARRITQRLLWRVIQKASPD